MRRIMLVASIIALVGLLAPHAVAQQGPPKSGPPGQHNIDPEVIGYFISWGVYERQFFVNNLIESGAADHLTVINYAFGNAMPENVEWLPWPVSDYSEPDGDPENVVCKVGDSWADFGLPIAPENSVDGVGDIWGEELRGNFNQLRKLKEVYPDLRVMISLGGWTWSKFFSDAALTPESREHFVESCIDLFIRGNLPVIDDAGGPGSAAGVFDGIDLDWEWPGSDGHPHNIIRAEDKENFTLLVEEFRSQLDELGQETGEYYELTAFLPAAPAKIDLGFEVPELMDIFDFVTVQGYDLNGAWDLSATNHHSQLYSPKKDPNPARFSVNQTIDAYLDRGAPADQLVLGVPFYGRGWTGVTNQNRGLYQPATSAAPGALEAGFEEYRNLKGLTDQGFKRFWDGQAQVPWLFDGETFWTYEDPQSLNHKTRYVRLNGLGGIMFWELSGDTDDAELVNAISTGLRERGRR